ncbi:MAG: L-serine ammonia-lyase [Nocardia sp.]|nr:L-serine ammonia-lyase [Nocardia sp.]
MPWCGATRCTPGCAVRHDGQRLRPVQSRYRALEFAYGGADARSRAVRRSTQIRGGAAQYGFRTGSLGATGRGHGSVEAVVAGLSGELPETVDPDVLVRTMSDARETGTLHLGGVHSIAFAVDDDIELLGRTKLAFHTNGMLFQASGGDGEPLAERQFYSVGGGFVLDEDEINRPDRGAAMVIPHPFGSAVDLLARTTATGLPISALVRVNEMSWR